MSGAAVHGRRRRWLLAIVAAALWSVVAAPVGAQSSGTVEIIRTDLSDYPTIRLGVAVSGEVASAGLDAERLVVTEDDTAVTATVQPVGADSLAVVLAIDVSGSMAGEPLLQAKSAAVQFLDQLPASASVGVVAFDDEAVVVSPVSTDRVATRSAIIGLAEDGGTALYDAIGLAAATVEQAEAERTALLVLTDGADTSSNSDLAAVSDALEDEASTFYVVELETGDSDSAALQVIADAGGGRVVQAADPAALNAAYVDLGQRIVNQYTVTFESASDAVAASYEVAVPGTGASDTIRVALPNTPGSSSGQPSPSGDGEVAQLVREGDAGILGQTWVLYVGAALLAVSLVALGSAFVAQTGDLTVRRRSLATDADVDPDAGPGERFVGAVRRGSAELAERVVGRTDARSGIDHSLDRAGLVIRAGEFLALVVGIGVAASLVMVLVAGFVGLVIAVLATAVGAPVVLSFLARRRSNQFADQLGDALLLMAGALRAGFGVAGAVDSVAQEMNDPMGPELQRAMLEIRLGRDIEDALGDVAERHHSEDFGWVVDAIRIHRQVGGDLAEILEKVSETIRARTRLRRQVRALTAEGRLSAIVLGLLPFGIALTLYASNPDYLEPLYNRTAGQFMLVASVAMLAAGIAWLRKLIDMEI